MINREYLFSTAKLTEQQVLRAASLHNPLYNGAKQMPTAYCHDAETFNGDIAIEIKCNTRAYDVDMFERSQSFKKNSYGQDSYTPNALFQTLDNTTKAVHLMIRRSNGMTVVYDMRAEEELEPLRNREFINRSVMLSDRYYPTKFVELRTEPIDTFTTP